MLIDTHCHLTDNYVPVENIPDVIRRARDAGVGTIVVSSADPNDPPKVVALCEKYDNLFCTIGIHPEFAGKIDFQEQGYRHLLSHPCVVGIGEIGLDYHYGTDNRAAQSGLFRAWLDIAVRAGLPVAVHSRDAESDTADTLCAPEFARLGGGGAPGVMHFHCMPWEFTKKLLDRGFYFSAAGIITFKNADAERDVFRRLPLDRLVIETDAPWCAPVPYRGKTCEPAMMTETARALASLHGISSEELEPILKENTKRLYPKLKI